MIKLSGYIDLAFCLIVLPVMALVFPVERLFHNFPIYMGLLTAWFYLLYFLNRRFTVPSLCGANRRRLLGILILAASAGITFLFSQTYLYTPRMSPFDQGIYRVLPRMQPYQQAIWSLFMIVEAFSFAVGLLTRSNRQKALIREAEAARDRAEIDLYRAQIKPHFMFNTLNSIYGLFVTHNDKALPSLEKFISMMRYVHASSARNLVPLSEEAGYIREYVELQSLRLSGKTVVKLRIDIENGNLCIPPMLLVAFVENCFKHGVSPEQESMIRISLEERNGCLLFSTANSIFPGRRHGDGTGIANCRKRLELLYPARHSLSASVLPGEKFEVKLNISLSDD